jgi:hypothetical protein
MSSLESSPSPLKAKDAESNYRESQLSTHGTARRLMHPVISQSFDATLAKTAIKYSARNSEMSQSVSWNSSSLHKTRPTYRVDVRDMICIKKRDKVLAPICPNLEKPQKFTFRKETKEKEASFMNLIMKKSKFTVAPSHYKRPDLDLFVTARPKFCISKAARVSSIGEEAKRKEYIPGMKYDLSDKLYRTIGTINL